MDSRTLVTSQNGDNRQLTFNPELRKMTRLGDLKGPQIIKSPSWPSSPTIPRSETRRKMTDPAFWTLDRKGLTEKVSSESFRNEFSLNDNKKSPDETFKEIHSILSNMDIAKYYLRGPKEPLNCSQGSEEFPLRRSLSVQPQTTSSFNGSSKKSFLDSIPPPPKTKSILEMGKDILPQMNKNYPKETIYSLELSPVGSSRKHINSKLKELTERLRPASAPPSPHRIPKYTVPRSAPPMSNFSFWKDPLPTENPLILPLNRIDKSFKQNDDFLDDSSTTKSKGNKISKPTRKNNLASFGYATLPRTKVLETQNEPRTLASLDLNINFQSYRENQTLSDADDSDSSKSSAFHKSFKHRDLKEIGKGETKREFINENICLNKIEREENHDVSSPFSSRRGSIKGSSNVSPKKADFDLNFSKYGSLNSSSVVRRRSLGKKDTNSLDKSSNVLEPKKCSLDGIQIFNQNDSTSNFKSETAEDETENNNAESKAFADKSRPRQSDGTKSVPALPSSFSNPLEEEIRAIAKLLDGKESLFLKLIQSSKIENEASKQAINSYRAALTPKEIENTDKTETSSGVSQKVISLPSADRNSPTRLRAMTVPGTEPSWNTITHQTSPPPQQKRFYKKRLRGPYGEMLEQEMSKSFNKPRPSYAKDLDFLKELENPTSGSCDQQSGRQRQLLRSSSHSFDETHSIVVENSPKRKTSANIPLVSGNESLRVPSTSVSGTVSEPTLHIRSHSDSVKASSAWNVDNIIAKAQKNSSQQVSTFYYS
ncbi:uncharacterized protein NPIL_505521 [Nephila pilipes]|uniref:Uncharacterized protein n=1 Tax=Nephila pilipes TaxID=299642 RepID=A0A8X6QXI5_NEPPI|nr:uncharacterized protein NPIL_505521 [Nephila pilipes]